MKINFSDNQPLLERSDIKPDLLIQGGLLLSMQPGAEPLQDARLLIQKDRILDILAPGEENPRSPAVETLDAREIMTRVTAISQTIKTDA